ncbi:hypothetical protein D9M69_649800 [compost metagenome]
MENGATTEGDADADTVVDMVVRPAYFQMFHEVCIRPPTSSSQTKVTGMKIFQPRRMIWS